MISLLAPSPNVAIPVRAHTFLFVICRRPPLVGAGSHFLPGEPTPGEMSKTQGEIPAAGGLFLVSSAAGGTIPGGKQQENRRTTAFY